MNRPIVIAFITLLTALVTNADRVTLLWERVFGPPPPPATQGWTHYTTRSTTDLENYLNRIAPSPSNLAAYSSWPDLHIWYRGGSTGTHYVYRDLQWRGEEHPAANFFLNDGKIVPIGFGVKDGKETTAYFEVVGSPK